MLCCNPLCSGYFSALTPAGPCSDAAHVTLCCLPQGKDDITGEPLIQHDDDKPEALMSRLRHYKDVAKPVIDLYKSVNVSFSCLHIVATIFRQADNAAVLAVNI